MYSAQPPQPPPMSSTNPPIPTQNPPINALIPPIPPPPSPSLGFQAWASDPQNALKVAHVMTPLDQPLQPNASAAANPPGPMMASAMPPTPMPNLPASVTNPVQSGAQAQLAADQAKQRAYQTQGAGVDQIKNPVGRAFAKIGDIALTAVSPGIAALVPGTTMHNRLLQQQQQGIIGQDQAAIQGQNQQQQAQLQQQLDQSNIAHTNAETAAIPINAGMKRQQYLAALAAKGQKEDENGNIVDDPNSEAFQREQAQIDSYKANVELKEATAAYNNAKTDPNSPLFKQTAQRLATAQQNARAAQVRANAYMGNYLQGAYNTGLNGQVLPGAPQIGGENGDTVTVGSKNATTATKANSNVAMFNEVDNATKGMRQTAANLIKSGGQLNDARVAAAIADPKTTAGEWAQGNFVNSGLSPAQRDYVIAVKAYKERLQPLRKSAGGSVSDEQVNRLMQMAPGPQTPDLDYLNRQLDQIDQLRTNLSTGVATAAGGLKVHGQPRNNMQPPTSGATTYKQTASGPAGQIGSNDGGQTWFYVKTGKQVQ